MCRDGAATHALSDTSPHPDRPEQGGRHAGLWSGRAEGAEPTWPSVQAAQRSKRGSASRTSTPMDSSRVTSSRNWRPFSTKRR